MQNLINLRAFVIGKQHVFYGKRLIMLGGQLKVICIVHIKLLRRVFPKLKIHFVAGFKLLPTSRACLPAVTLQLISDISLKYLESA
jgi:hypothetical protein